MQTLTQSPYSYAQNRIIALLSEIEKHGDSVPESIRKIAEAEDFRQIKTGETIICNFGVWGADDLQDSLESAEASDASTADRIEILKRIALQTYRTMTGNELTKLCTITSLKRH